MYIEDCCDLHIGGYTNTTDLYIAGISLKGWTLNKLASCKDNFV